MLPNEREFVAILGEVLAQHAAVNEAAIGNIDRERGTLNVASFLAYLDGDGWAVVRKLPTDPVELGEMHNATLCARLLVGQGTDQWDPICVRPVGHAGPCSKTAVSERV